MACRLPISKESQVRSKKPKRTKTKKRPKKVPTPTPEGDHACCECGKTKYLEIHHIFFGDKSTRDNSSRYKAVEWCCYHCHRAQPTGIHGGNRELDLKLKRKHQKRLESEGMSREEFRRLFGKSYLEE